MIAQNTPISVVRCGVGTCDRAGSYWTWRCPDHGGTLPRESAPTPRPDALPVVEAGPRSLSFALPYPPSVNHYWRHVWAKILVSAEGREYRKRVAALLTGTKPMVGPLSVSVEIHPPDRRRRDLDNCMKSLLDALQHGGAYEDDSQIARLLVERRDVMDGGKAVVAIDSIKAALAATEAK